VKRAVWQRARVPIAHLSPENRQRVAGIHPEGFRDKALDARVPISRDRRDIMIVVASGAGKHSAVIPTFGMARSITPHIED
jgi:hypothetical protein